MPPDRYFPYFPLSAVFGAGVPFADVVVLTMSKSDEPPLT
jgi:hypothetical protein